MKKPIKWAASFLLIICLAGYFIYSSTQPLEAEWLKIEPKTVSQTFTEEGVVSSVTERPVYSKISGHINHLAVKEGQQVKKGDILAEIELKDLEFQQQQLKAQKKSLLGQERKNEQEIQLQLGQLKGQLESIQGQERQANKNPYTSQIRMQQLAIEDIERQLGSKKEDYYRIQQLYERGAISKQEWEQTKLDVNQLENNLLQQEQALKLIEEQVAPLPGTDQYYSGLKNAVITQIEILQDELKQRKKGTASTQQYYQGLIESIDVQIGHLEYQMANTKVLAPIEGIIKELEMKEGAMITTQSPLLTLISVHELEVEVYLLTEDVIQVTEGIRVQLIQKRKDGDYSFKGTVMAIAPAAEEKISALGLTQHKVKVTITPDDQVPELRPGYVLDVVFTTLEQANKLAIPKSVLFPYEDGDALWLVKNGKAIIQKVEKGMEADELVVIEQGLQAGDQVIKNPQLEGLKQGKRIEGKIED